MTSDWGIEGVKAYGGAVALQLDGAGAHAAFDRPLVPADGPFSIAVTFAARPSDGHRELVSQDAGDGKALYLGKAVEGHVRAGDDWQHTGVPFPEDDRWHTLVLVSGDGDAVLYLDGEERARLGRALVAPRGGEFRIGRQYGPFEEFFAGRIAEIVVWRIALDRAQVQAHVPGALIGGEAGLHALVRLDVPGLVLERLGATTARLIGGAWWQAPPAAALALDGLGAHAVVDRAVVPADGPFSIAVTFAARPSDGHRELVSQDAGDGAAFYLGQAAAGHVRAGDDWQDTGVPFPADDRWHTLVLVRGDADTVLYLDGEERARLGRALVAPRGGELRIGRQYGPFEEFFAGRIAEIAVWRGALAPSQVRAHVPGTASAAELHALIRLDGPDRLDPGLPLRLSGGTWWKDPAGPRAWADPARARGGALELDGAGAHAVFARPIVPIDGPFTIAVRFAARRVDGTAELLAQDAGDGAAFYLGNSWAGYVRAGDDWENTGVAFPEDDQWHTLVLVRGAADTVLYLDGEERARLGRAIVSPRGGEFRIGRQYGPHAEFFPGRIAEIAVWRDALDPSRVRAYAPGRLAGGEAWLSALIRLDAPGLILDRVGRTAARSIGARWTPVHPSPAAPPAPTPDLAAPVPAPLPAVPGDPLAPRPAPAAPVPGDLAPAVAPAAPPSFPAGPPTSVDLWRAGLVFDGRTAAIRLFADDLLVGRGRAPFTLEAWVRTLAHGRRMVLLDFGAAGSHQGGTLSLTPEGRLAFDLRGWAGPVSSVALHDGLWHHVAVVADDGLLRLHVDGQSSGEARAPAIDLRSGPAALGATVEHTDRFEGALAEVRAWTRAHTAGQIGTWRSARPVGEEADLVGWWPLESASNPGRDRSNRRRTGRAAAAMTALVTPPTAGPPGPVAPLVSVADVVAATPFHQLAQRLGGGVEVLRGVVVPVRVLLTPAADALNLHAVPGTALDAGQDAAWITRAPDGVAAWTDDVALLMDGPPIALSLADLDALLGDDERAAFTEAELAQGLPIELRDVVLPIDRKRRRLHELDLEFVLRHTWDIGAAWLDRPGLLQLRDPRLLLEIENPLHALRDPTIGLEGVVRLGSGDLRVGVELPDLVFYGDMVHGTKIYVREVLELFGADLPLPAPIRDMAIADLEFDVSPRKREGGFMLRMSDLFELSIAGRELALRELFLQLRRGPRSGVSVQLGGVCQLAGVPLYVRAGYASGALTFTGGLAPDLRVGGQRITANLYLDVLIEELLGGVGLPVDLPRIELKTLVMSTTPTEDRVTLTAAGAVDLPLGGSGLRIHEARLAYKQEGAFDDLELALDVSASFEDILTLDRFTLTFNYGTRPADPDPLADPAQPVAPARPVAPGPPAARSRSWRLRGTLQASMLGQRFALAVSLFDDGRARGLRFAAPDVALRLPLPLPASPDAHAALALKHLELTRPAPTREKPDPDWIAEVVVGLKLVGLPEPVLKVIPADVDLRGGFKDGSLTLGITRLFAPQRLELREVGPDKLDLGDMLIDLRELSLTVGKKPGLAGTLAIGLPSRLNHLFGTAPDGTPKIAVFRTYDPRRLEESLTRIALKLDLVDGLAVDVENPPFETVITGEGRWLFDLGEAGAISLGAPTLRSNGAGFHAGGELAVDPERGLWLPLTPLHDLLRQAGLGEVADRLPRRARVDTIDLLDARGRLDLARLLGVPEAELPAEVRGLLAQLGDLTEKLPAALRAFFSVRLRTLRFALTLDAAGNLCFDLEADPDAPVRALLPGFPSLVGIELRRLSFGPLLGGSLFRLDIDADVHVFDVATLLLAQVLPDDVMGRTLPARALLQRTLHLHDLFMVVVYQTGIPIPLPVFYTKLGFTYVGIEGLETSLQLYFNAPRLGREHRPSIDVREALKLINLLGRFLREPDYRLPATQPLQHMNLILGVDAAYLKLPSYLGGREIGTRVWEEIADVYRLTAGTLNTIKTGELRHVVAAVPLARRIGEVRLDLCGLFASEVGWVLATPDECATREAEVLALLADRGARADRGGLAAEVTALMPTATALALGDAGEPRVSDPDGLVLLLRGAFDVGGCFLADGLVLVRAGAATGFATAVRLSARIADLLALDLRGLVRLSRDGRGFQLAGATTLTMLGRRVLHGAFSLADDHLALDGLVDLFPPDAPLAVRAHVRGRLSRAGFSLAGAGEVSLLCFPLLAGEIEVAAPVDPITGAHRTRLRTTLLGATMALDLKEENGALSASGECSPITFGPLLTITGTSPGKGLTAALHSSPAGTSFTLDGQVTLLGLSLAARIAADREALRFDLATSFWIGEAALRCALYPQRGLEAHARFSLGAPGEPHALTTIEDGKPVTKTFALEAGITAQMWLRILREPTADLLAERARVHDALVAAQRSLLAAPLPARPDTDAARRELTGLRRALADVRALHLGLTLPGPSRLPLAALAVYLDQLAALRAPIDRLLAQAAELGEDARDDAERALWARLRVDLGVLRQAVDRGHAEAAALDAAERAFDAAFTARLDRLVEDGPAPDHPITAARSAGVRGLVRALHARALYPEAPWRREHEIDGCAAFCDGATRRHAERMEAHLTTLAAVATARDGYTARSASTRAAAYDALPSLRAKLPARLDIAFRLPAYEAAATRLGEQRGLLEAAWGTRGVAEAARAGGDADAAARLQALDAAEAAFQAALADLRWVHEQHVLLPLRAANDRLVDELRAARSPTHAVGGPGGAPFEDRPPAGARLAAILVRSGARVDAIQCAWQLPGGPLVWGARRGGDGGAPALIELRDGEQVLEISGRCGARIDSLTIRTNLRTHGPYGGGGGTQAFSLAPIGPVLGLHGRNGAELDAIGVIGPRYDLEKLADERGLASLQETLRAEEATRRDVFDRVLEELGAHQILLGRPVIDRSPGVRACRDAALRELAVRPLDGWRLPFVGLATPAAEAPPALAPLRPAATDAVRFGLALSLDFVRGGEAARISELTIDTPIQNLAAELPALIFQEVGRTMLGLRDDEALLRARLREHARRRDERRAGLGEYARRLRSDHGLTDATVRGLLIEAGFTADEAAAI